MSFLGNILNSSLERYFGGRMLPGNKAKNYNSPQKSKFQKLPFQIRSYCPQYCSLALRTMSLKLARNDFALCIQEKKHD